MFILIVIDIIENSSHSIIIILFKVMNIIDVISMVVDIRYSIVGTIVNIYGWWMNIDYYKIILKP